MTSEPLLQADDLCAWYGAAQILFGVSLQVQRGEVVALMGRNGAGKSTTLKALMGLLDRSQGQREFMGAALRAVFRPISFGLLLSVDSISSRTG